MDFERARFNMVEQQVRTWNVLDNNVLDTLMSVRRELFVPATYRSLAFADIRIPIGHGQFMLEPRIEGRVLQAVAVKKTDQVLEIGAGSGRMAALLAERADWVRTIEIEPRIAGFAHQNLERAGVENIIVEEGDGSHGWPERGPYDVIVVSGGLPELPPALLQQIKPGGRLFAFIGQAPVVTGQLVRCVEEGRFETRSLFETWVQMLKTPDSPHFDF